MAWTDREPDQKKRRRSTFTAQDWVIFVDYSYDKFEIPDELLPDADPVLSGFSRTDTEVDVFCKVFSRALIEELMEVIAGEDGRYWIRVNRKRRFYDSLDVLRMFAIRLYIQAKRPSYSPSDDINPFRTLYQKKIMLAFPEDQKILRADDYTAILNKFVTPCRYARGALSEHLSSLVCGGEAVALDERMHPWKGKGPCVRSIPSKPNSIGLWTTAAGCFHLIKMSSMEKQYTSRMLQIGRQPCLSTRRSENRFWLLIPTTSPLDHTWFFRRIDSPIFPRFNRTA